MCISVSVISSAAVTHVCMSYAFDPVSLFFSNAFMQPSEIVGIRFLLQEVAVAVGWHSYSELWNIYFFTFLFRSFHAIANYLLLSNKYRPQKLLKRKEKFTITKSLPPSVPTCATVLVSSCTSYETCAFHKQLATDCVLCSSCVPNVNCLPTSHCCFTLHCRCTHQLLVILRWNSGRLADYGRLAHFS